MRFLTERKILKHFLQALDISSSICYGTPLFASL